MDTKLGNYAIRQHADAIACRKCGTTGTVVWDDISRRNVCVSEQVGIDGPFFERLSKKPPYPIELVCRACGGVTLTAYPSTSLHEREKYN